MAKKVVAKKKVVKKEVVKAPVEITLGDNVQHVRIYPKYNPLRNK
tara:strand:+ start:328 stop:462 length:135 start_codon:yes stop_codon:yes gene_type:complete